MHIQICMFYPRSPTEWYSSYSSCLCAQVWGVILSGGTLNHQPAIAEPENLPYSANPKPLNPKPKTLNPKAWTLNPRSPDPQESFEVNLRECVGIIYGDSSMSLRVDCEIPTWNPAFRKIFLCTAIHSLSYIHMFVCYI